MSFKLTSLPVADSKLWLIKLISKLKMPRGGASSGWGEEKDAGSNEKAPISDYTRTVHTISSTMLGCMS